MKILLITRYFPPLDSIATARMYSWAKYLDQLGCSITILTTTKQGQVVVPFEKETSKFTIHEIDYFDPITFFGVDKQKEACASASQSRVKHVLKSFYRHRLNERIPGRTDLWVFPAKRFLKRMKERGQTFDWIISSYGPPSSHIVGAFAKNLFGGKWLADYRDLWIENHVFKGLWPFTSLEKYLEKRCLAEVDVITTVSEGLQKKLSHKFPMKPVNIIENGYDEEDIVEASDDYFAEEPKKFRIIYTGSIYPGKRDPSPLFIAIKELIYENKIQKDNLEVLFYGSHPGDLLSLIQHYGVSVFVRFCGMIPSHKVRSLQKSSDMLLFLEDDSPQVDGILTGKLFEYLSIDKPILGVGIKETSAPGKVIIHSGAGAVCHNDVVKIKDVILNSMTHGYKLNKKHDFIQQFSRKKQVNRLFNIMSGH